MTRIKANLALLLITICWGVAFPLTQMLIRTGMSPNAIVMIKGLLFFTCCCIFYRKQIAGIKARQFAYGALIGAFNLLGNVMQMVSMEHTTPSHSAFLTVTNVIMVPFITLLLFRERPPKKSIISVPLCVLGMAVLTGVLQSGASSFNLGDAQALVGALGFAVMIVLLAKADFDYKIVAFGLSTVQFAGALLIMLVSGDMSVSSNNWAFAVPVLLYLGIVATFVTASVQCMAQQYVSSTSAALIMTMESVFGSVFSILMGMEALTVALFAGGALIILSVIMMETNLLPVLQEKN